MASKTFVGPHTGLDLGTIAGTAQCSGHWLDTGAQPLVGSQL